MSEPKPNDQEEPFRTAGQLIEALLAEKGWSQRVLAIVLGVEETGVNKLIADKRPVTADIAIPLEEVFGVSADRFLLLQKKFDLAKARITARPDPRRVTRAHLFGGLPITEMIKRGWLEVDDVRNVAGVEKALTKFFDADSLDQIEILPHAAKKTAVSPETTPAQLAWLYRVRQIACDLLVSPFSNAAVESAIKLLKPLLVSSEAIRKVPRILREAGIRFVIVESLPGAKIDGVCFWLNDKSPVIGMSLRFDRIDNFWFVLRHELEHVLRGHGKGRITIDVDLSDEGNTPGAIVSEEEKQANVAAAEFCVPQAMMEAFVVRKSPLFAERDVLAFASMLRVHPGLVAGQLRRRTGRYNIFATHLVKVRASVSSGAAVDGWGDIAPVGL